MSAPRQQPRTSCQEFNVNVSNLLLNLTSDNPGRMHAFYRDVVGLEPNPDMGDFGLHLGPGASLVIDGHHDISGRTKEPARVLIDLFVDNVVEAENELKAKGVTFFRSQGREYWGGIISSFEDPDGNYVQVIEFDPSGAFPEPKAAVTA